MIQGDRWLNKLYFGDNLPILRAHIPDNYVDLIYLDPPFNSNADYNVLYRERDGTAPKSQIAAFNDTWRWTFETEEVYRKVVSDGPIELGALLQNFLGFLRRNDMMAYLVMMAIRLVELRRVLKPTGSIFLHCDPTASHYLKLLMDAAFGAKNFCNEIIWERTTPKAHIKRRFPNSHDVILFYGKSESVKFNMIFTPHSQRYLETHYRYVEPETGRRYDLTDLTNPNPNRPNLTYEFPPDSGVVKVWRWTKEKMMEAWERGQVVLPPHGGIARFKRYLDEQKGAPCKTVWTDVPPLNSQAKERLGYPTQKPEALLERIINVGSNEGDVVLDPFCGCGTTVNVAERLNRRWIGVDITHLAISLMRHRLQNTFAGDLSPYEVIGEPKDLESAKALIEDRQLYSRYQFEWWALSLVGARPARDKKVGADKGVDGYIFFFDDNTGIPKKIVVQVKSGEVKVDQIRDLLWVMEREEAKVCLFITLNPPKRTMIEEAAAAGSYMPEALGEAHRVPKCQILTIDQLLSGAKPQYPRLAIATFKEAPRQHKGKGPTQPGFL